MIRLLPFLIVLLTVNITIGQSSRVMENQTLESRILKESRKYAIYLPPGYENNDRSYPVLYLLHGLGDDQTGWVQFGEVQHITDKSIAEGKSTQMIIVMPDANSTHIGYFNHPDGKWRYEDFFFEELIPHIESKYRVRKERRYRAISGLSMGGGGTLMYALKNPSYFTAAAPLSAYVGELSLADFKSRFESMLHDLNETEIVDYYENHNALSLVKNSNPKDLQGLSWYIDCGDDDFLFEGNSLLHIEMTKAQIKHEYRVRQGGHTWTYWRSSLPEVLNFISKKFHQY